MFGKYFKIFFILIFLTNLSYLKSDNKKEQLKLEINNLLDKYLEEDSFETRFLGQDLLKSLLMKIRDYSQFDPKYNQIATVRLSSDLCTEEKNFLEQRQKFVRDKLINFNSNNSLDLPANFTVPKISFCFSGGGYRAMIAALGTLKAAQEVGLLDISTYIACLSGSTWPVSAWANSGLSLDEIISYFREQSAYNLTDNFRLSRLFLSSLTQLAYGQKLTIVGIWGLLLGNRLLPKAKYNHLLSAQQNNILSQNLPLPIYTAAIPTFMHKINHEYLNKGKAILLEKISNKDNSSIIIENIREENFDLNFQEFKDLKAGATEYDWMEFTTFEIGSRKLKSFVPAWSFGRGFSSGQSINYYPQLHIGFCMGIWGSAFEANLNEILDDYQNKLPAFLSQPLDFVTSQDHRLGKIRFFPASFQNFAFGIKDHPLSKLENLTLVDGGIFCNLPLAPLLRPEREQDIIIVCDNSADLVNAPELNLAYNYALKENFKFPKVNNFALQNSTISVIQDSSIPNAPIIIYMPCVKNPEYNNQFDPVNCLVNDNSCFLQTTNLKYTNAQFDELFGLTYFNMKSNFENIKIIINQVIENKK